MSSEGYESPLGILRRYYQIDLSKIQKNAQNDNPIDERQMIIQGNKATGKTTHAKTFAALMRKHYGAENINVIIAHTFRDTIAGFDDRPIQILIIDDPLKTKGMGFSSYRTQQSYDNFDLFFDIRHEAQKRSESIKYLCEFICTQRLFGALDPNFRIAASVIGIKSIAIAECDNDSIKKFLGDDARGKQLYETLKHIDYSLYVEQNYKSRALMPFVGRGNVRDVAKIPIEWLPQDFQFDKDMRPTYQARLEEVAKEDKYKMMQVAVFATFRRFSEGKTTDLVKFLREKEGMAFQDKFAFEVMAYQEAHPDATLIQVQEIFGCKLPDRYYRKKALEELRSRQSLETKYNKPSVQANIEKNQADFEKQKLEAAQDVH